MRKSSPRAYGSAAPATHARAFPMPHIGCTGIARALTSAASTSPPKRVAGAADAASDCCIDAAPTSPVPLACPTPRKAEGLTEGDGQYRMAWLPTDERLQRFEARVTALCEADSDTGDDAVRLLPPEAIFISSEAYQRLGNLPEACSPRPRSRVNPSESARTNSKAGRAQRGMLSKRQAQRTQALLTQAGGRVRRSQS